jgi:peroxiredoxin
MQALDLDLPLLSDWNGDATQGFGVAFEYRGLRDVSARSAFLVDQGGVIRAVWSYDVAAVPDFDEILAAAREL